MTLVRLEIREGYREGDPCEVGSPKTFHKDQLTSKVNSSKDVPRLTFSWPFSNISSSSFIFPVHPIGFSFCILSYFLAILILLSSTITPFFYLYILIVHFKFHILIVIMSISHRISNTWYKLLSSDSVYNFSFGLNWTLFHYVKKNRNIRLNRIAI